MADPDPADERESEIARAVLPVRPIPPDGADEPAAVRGLCLSGGGYRAMLFHLGALLRLNEAGRLPGLARVSSVSGGSITAAVLGHRWSRLEWSPEGIATNLEDCVVAPVRALARETVDVWAVLKGLHPFKSVGEQVAAAYDEHLFAGATLADLPGPGGPQFIINATNLESGVLFRFSHAYAADWRVGLIEAPRIPLARAVAASSAFPPVLSPFEIDLREERWTTVRGNELDPRAFRGEIALSDGGVYDNLGLETVWKRCREVLVSDGGGQMPDDDDPPHDWPRQTLRVLKVIDNQVRDLRKRQVVGSYELGLRDGTYWGIRSDVGSYRLRDPLPFPPEEAARLAALPTRLAALPERDQEQLVNWGYVICDTALRRWVDPSLARPEALPYP